MADAEIITFDDSKNRPMKAWLSLPVLSEKKLPAVLVIHGIGDQGRPISQLMVHQAKSR